MKYHYICIILKRSKTIIMKTRIDFIDAAPNAGAVTYIAKKVSDTLGIEFKPPISRYYQREYGYDFQFYESQDGGLICLFFDDGKVSLCRTVREGGPGSTYLEEIKPLSKDDLDLIIKNQS